MPSVIDPVTGLQLVELSNTWGYNTPMFPGFDDMRFERISRHGSHGVMTQRFTCVFHASTHVNAPVHLVPGAAGVGQIPMERFFGNGVVLDIPKEKWGLITDRDLAAAKPAIRTNDIVIIVTGWHEKYSDSKEYFGYAPGLSKAAAQWLVKKKVKMVAIDTADIDHPLATSLAQHRNGPLVKYLVPEYKKATGRDPKKDHPEWRIAHRTLLAAGIPTVEGVGGDVGEVTGKRCTLQGFPWNWRDGDACYVRLVAMFDPSGSLRLESGRRA